MRFSCFIAWLAASLALAGEVRSEAVRLPDLDLAPDGDCRTLSLRNPATGIPVPIGCIDIARNTLVVPLSPPGEGPAQGSNAAGIRTELRATTFGARCDGKSDDTAALRSWLKALTSGSHGVLPAGTCVFREPLVLANVGQVSISGAGPYATVLMYAGSDTSVDLIAVGEAGNEAAGLSLTDFRVASQTRMTAGAGIRWRWYNRSQIWRVILDGQDGNGNLWRGIWFDGVDQVSFMGFEARGQESGITVNGVAGNRGPRAGLMLGGGWKITGSRTGIHLGGAFGGLYIDQGDFGANGRNILIDSTIANEGNREIMIGPLATSDLTTSGAGIEINDEAQTGSAFIGLTGAWLASARTHGLWVRSWKNSLIVITGGTVFNNGGDGIRVDDSSARLRVTGTSLRANRGAAIRVPAGSHQSAWSSLDLHGNGEDNRIPANARSQPSGEPRPQGAVESNGPPRGSFAESCRGVGVQHGVLAAACRDRSGQYRDTQVEIGDCQSFSNRDGKLVCER